MYYVHKPRRTQPHLSMPKLPRKPPTKYKSKRSRESTKSTKQVSKAAFQWTPIIKANHPPKYINYRIRLTPSFPCVLIQSSDEDTTNGRRSISQCIEGIRTRGCGCRRPVYDTADTVYWVRVVTGQNALLRIEYGKYNGGQTGDEELWYHDEYVVYSLKE